MIRTLLKAEDFTKSCWGCSGVQLAPLSWCWRHWAVSLGLGSSNEGEQWTCQKPDSARRDLAQLENTTSHETRSPWGLLLEPKDPGHRSQQGWAAALPKLASPCGPDCNPAVCSYCKRGGEKAFKVELHLEWGQQLTPPSARCCGGQGWLPRGGITEVTEPNPPGCSTEELGRLCCCSSPRCQGCGSSIGALPAAAQVPPGPSLGPSATLLGRGGGLLLRFWRCVVVQALQQHFSSDPTPFARCKRQFGPERGAKTSEKLSLCCRLASSWIRIIRRLLLGFALGGAAQRTLVAVEEWLQGKRR